MEGAENRIKQHEEARKNEQPKKLSNITKKERIEVEAKAHQDKENTKHNIGEGKDIEPHSKNEHGMNTKVDMETKNKKPLGE